MPPKKSHKQRNDDTIAPTSTSQEAYENICKEIVDAGTPDQDGYVSWPDHTSDEESYEHISRLICPTETTTWNDIINDDTKRAHFYLGIKRIINMKWGKKSGDFGLTFFLRRNVKPLLESIVRKEPTDESPFQDRMRREIPDLITWMLNQKHLDDNVAFAGAGTRMKAKRQTIITEPTALQTSDTQQTEKTPLKKKIKEYQKERKEREKRWSDQDRALQVVEHRKVTAPKRIKKRPIQKALSKASIRRLAKRGGCRRMSGLVAEEARDKIKQFVTDLTNKATYYTENRKAVTVTAMDVIYALRSMGKQLYGYT